MIALDHIAIWSNNLFDTTYRISQGTGIGNCDGGFFPGLGFGQKVISLGGDVYIEVESMADHQQVLDRSRTSIEMERQIAHGDCFAAWCLRSDDIGEMNAFSRHFGKPLTEGIPGGKFRMSGESSAKTRHIPVFWESWFIGMPNIYYVPDLSSHSSRLPPQEGTGKVVAQGVTAIEIGGSEDDLKRWLGDVCDPRQFSFDIGYNNKDHGLYEVFFDTDDGPKSIRLNPVVSR
ncbi:VOC family protein [Pseudonocardia kujensis]|uniref:VOC family protein n=1 Tax=Pseudonocardia kujensis TaxID=1128675 RepID=UPI001E488AC7|nr:VOC family protein [Pseudonocardia kujensis]MCE0764094.1 VOC family protein [Pseudonocardia kujensis]